MYLIEVYIGGVRTPVAVGKYVKHCYSFATFAGQIADPNQTYKISTKQIKKEGKALLWDRSRFGSIEEAQYSPIGSYVTIQPIKSLH